MSRSCLAGIILIILSQCAMAEWRFETLTTSTGTTYSNATVNRIDGGNAILIHPGGVVPVAIADLPDSALQAMGLPSKKQQELRRKEIEFAKETLLKKAEKEKTAQREKEECFRQLVEKQRKYKQQRMAIGLIKDEETDSMEQVALFPAKYVGQTNVFSSCHIVCDLYKSVFLDYYALSIKSKGGKFFCGRKYLNSDDLNFLVNKEVAEQMGTHLEGSKTWTKCKVEVNVQQVEHRGKKYFVGHVTRINLFSSVGMPIEVFFTPVVSEMDRQE